VSTWAPRSLTCRSWPTWKDQTLVAEEIAVIIPVHENVLDDASVALLDEISALGGQAIGKKLDQAVLFAIEKPASWTSPALIESATPDGIFTVVDGAANVDDLWGAIAQAAGYVADNGADPTALVLQNALRWQLANLRDADGRPVFSESQLAGFTTLFNKNGAWDPTMALAFVVDPSLGRIGVRQDITVKFLDQATVGGINLAERDMVALRLKARFAYVLADAISSAGTPIEPVAAVAATPVTP
jgi:HK97 family phage major capsid protein